MDPENFPTVLRERLGTDGVAALAEVLAWYRDDVVTLDSDRFERRLTEECGQLRAGTAALGNDLRTEMAALGTVLRTEMATLGTDLRTEMTALGTDLRTEMAALGTDLRAEMALVRTELRSEIDGVRGELRSEMGALRDELKTDMAGLRSDMQGLDHRLRAEFKIEVANARAELLKWSFVFWVGQVAAVVGLVAVLR